ncbi:MAG TPA: phytanoyl-CoA dioxygenase family protein [Phycisphaerae bacterium]|nr:phytanoyl-CoA dioxygenase family protein [Phycisphaerae bacterium]HOJ73234.1 phytanoyl-CoA dioxygenase family protein [Phycisphaerae bacterium]HOM51200.1 phytanoyl-CoA dioxygenase family protein [Phycisphaerae bacterium]HON65453.1 phytanoyl-CoA dioxygenase family protein [Phycisphaerae bacterium]HOQ85308.1 phytanoyl-CoA dioxygenase family protein [Phycisphaerae bacterium]
MLTAEQVEFFHRNGYVRGGKLLELDEVHELRERLDAVLAGKSDTGGRVEYAATIENKDPAVGGVLQVVNIWKQDSVFRRHHSRPALVEMARQLTGTPVLRIFHDQILSKPPRNGRPVNWHQDYGYWQMVTPADLITCWVALDDATIANGCMQVIPGSHRWGLLAANTNLGDDDPEAILKLVSLPPGEKLEKVAIELPAGHCMWHHCLTLHGTDVNRTDKPRRAVITHLMPGHCRYDSRYEHLMGQFAEAEGLRHGDVLRGAHFPEV